MSATTTPIQKIFAQVRSARGLSFPETVAALLALGVTRYHVDYTSLQVTTYARHPRDTTAAKSIDTEQIAIPSPVPVLAPAPSSAESKYKSQSPAPDKAWDKNGLVHAIRQVQSGGFKNYGEFATACVESGVVGYLAFLTGRRVVYYGCEGDTHVEWFPGAEPRSEQK